MIVTPGFAEYRRALQSVDCAVREFLLREEDGWQLTGAILDALTPESGLLISLHAEQSYRPAARAPSAGDDC
ncbi:L-threonine 3-O-phosphate decarboxylase [Klebsiella michiganensis]|uniref:L-threonine 3-O-phosphate decarboxylase n=1 Tax=Klebsiella michiganensis TaxID=1134687 RepID=A0A7H4PIN5_9ENTR|nr:L-threonine 3-O-phosphate decarboxylase [Klebsiella michiganensis]